MLVILLVILALFAIKCAWSHHYTRSIGTFDIGEALAAWRSFQFNCISHFVILSWQLMHIYRHDSGRGVSDLLEFNGVT